MKPRIVSISALSLLCASAMSAGALAQAPAQKLVNSAPNTLAASLNPPVKEPAMPTEIEQLRMQAAGLINQLNEQTKATHKAIEERDDARLQLALVQASPVREGFVYDWSVGRFREPKSGQVWDFEKKALVDDEKTPKKKGDGSE